MADSGHEPARRTGALLLLTVFLLGLVCGAALLFLGQRSARVVRGGERPRIDRPGHERGPGPMLRELGLDEKQRERVLEIMREDRQEIHAILEETRLEIRSLLGPEQQEIFDRMRPEGPGFGRGQKGGRRGFRHVSPDGPRPGSEPPPPPPPGAPGSAEDNPPPPPAGD
jgi:hypothetical protein